MKPEQSEGAAVKGGCRIASAPVRKVKSGTGVAFRGSAVYLLFAFFELGNVQTTLVPPSGFLRNSSVAPIIRAR